MEKNKIIGIIAILTILAGGGYLLYPKKIYIGGKSGLRVPGESNYYTQYKCLGFTKRTQQSPDFGGDLLCFGLRYNKQCFKSIDFKPEQIACEEIPQPPPPPPRYGVGRKEEETVNDQELQINTSNWKIYRNEKYGFEMRYPDNILEVFTYAYEGHQTSVSFAPSSKQPPASFEVRHENLEDIDGYLREWQSAEEYAMYLKKPFQKITIGNIELIDVRNTSEEGDFSRWLFTIRGKTMVQVLYFWFSGFEDFQNTFDPMLSTFKFIK